jgi:V/A-type H+/Na+-transporting ATPase subunit F
MSRAVAIGEKHLILGFKGVGFEIIPVEDSSKVGEVLNGLVRQSDVGLVFVTESIAKDAAEAIRDFRVRSSAILTLIPSHEGSDQVSFQEIRRSVERSLGLDILGKD